ncbi:MAG: helix-turn-helix transcriptional regulator [Leptolyngbya sp. LCM1.Bin17]|nr:MAG: helix-turn-helix transcriptional regulator [Leptolyngbya sp. LCM1.Bin17]
MVTMSSSVMFSMPLQSTLSHSDHVFLRAVLEGFADGILILAEDGSCIHSNQEGRAICRNLSANSHGVPPCLWAMGKQLLDSRELFPDHSLVLTQQFTAQGGDQIRARVQWLDLPSASETYLLISLENQTRSTYTSALLEAVQYNLTPREKDVWLLRRASRSYDEIAKALYITVNTVKRHIKNINAKRREVTELMAN